MPLTHLYFVTSAFLLGLGAVLSKLLLSVDVDGDTSPNPLQVLTFQLLGGIGFLLSVRIVSGWRLEPLMLLQRPALAGAILGVGSVGTILAIALISASEAALVFATQPLIVLGLAWILLRERIGAPATALCCAAVCGVLLTVIGGGPISSDGRAVGFVFAVLSNSCAALYTVWMRDMTARQDVLTALIVVQGVSCLIASAVWATAWQIGYVRPVSGGTFFVLLSFGSGALYYGAAYFLYVLGLKTTEASVAGIYLTLVPIFTIALARVFLSETLTALQWVGASVVICAVGAIFLLYRRAD
ncbi:MAG: DMT family transporter [Pseudomonadota bacterium]